MRYLLFLLFLLAICSPQPGVARVVHGIYISDKALEKMTQDSIALKMKEHPLLIHGNSVTNAIEKPHSFQDKNVEFLIAIFLIGFLGVFKNWNRLYFKNLGKAFRSSSLSKRQLKEQLQQDQIAEILMNAFFCLSVSLYLFLVFKYFGVDSLFPDYSKLYVILALFLGFVLMFSFRFLFLKMAGWLFGVPEMMDNYSFQIFLLNKITGIVLIPFIFILAFGTGSWVQVSLVLSFILIGGIFIYRYFRSGQSFRHFLKLSRFHFFMYLCASEILPWAILIKAISLWLYLK